MLVTVSSGSHNWSNSIQCVSANCGNVQTCLGLYFLPCLTLEYTLATGGNTTILNRFRKFKAFAPKKNPTKPTTLFSFCYDSDNYYESSTDHLFNPYGPFVEDVEDPEVDEMK